MIRVAITGATGFLGRYLVQEALARGYAVVAVARRPEALRDLGVDVRAADLAEPDQLRAAFEGCDAVIANAAMLSGEGGLEVMRRVNVLGTENTLRAAAGAGARRVVLVSTVAVYHPRLGRPMAEDGRPTDTARRRWAWRDLTTDWRYAMSKTEAEQRAWVLARELDLRLTSVRPGPIYGRGDAKVTASLLRLARWPVLVMPTVGVPFVHVSDVAGATVAALERGQSVGRPYNLCAAPESPYQFFRALRRATGRGPWVLPLPLPTRIAFDSEAARRDLDFSPRDLAVGVRDLGAP